jgi:uncharacterized protein YgbK (DUF1537 family)
MSRPESQHTGAPKIGIVADDLTGACDSGIEFLRCSPSVEVTVEPSSQQIVSAEQGILVRNTQSRNVPPEEAYDRSFEATRHAISSGADIIFKKVDSALRGNFSVELGAVMDAAAAPVAFLLPAIPEAGRQTVCGIQHIDGIPIAESFYANDPEHPVTESCVLTLAEKESGRKAGLVSLEEVRAGNTAEAATSLQKEGRQLIVVDARLPGDLRGAVKSLLHTAPPRLFVGCQGLAQALAGELPEVGELPLSHSEPSGPLLFVCGTSHPRSSRQLDIAAESGDVELVEIEMNRAGRAFTAPSTLEELTRTCKRKLLAGQNVAVRARGCPTKAVTPDFCKSVLACLTDLCERLVRESPPGVLVLTGGETAYSVCRALDIAVLKLHARIAPLVVACEVAGGPGQGMMLVLKGGSIGPDDLVSRIRSLLYFEK